MAIVWIKDCSDDYVNLEYVKRIYIHKQKENNWEIYADIGSENECLIACFFKTKEEAQLKLDEFIKCTY